jgi:hypothetical protein
MSSITTVVPSGIIKSWCLAEQLTLENNVFPCANSTLGQTPSDFETICCDGDIIDTTQNLFNRPASDGPLYVNIDNLVCCRLTGPQQGGIGPIDPDQTHCTAGSPTPLASLAATNVDNAADFPVTYTSASYGVTYTSGTFGETTTGDFIPIQTPWCVWMNTNTSQSDGVAVQTVTVPAAHISTMPAATTDALGNPISSLQTGVNSASFTKTSNPNTISVSTTTATSRSSAAATRRRAPYYGSSGILGIGMSIFILHSLTLG